MRNNDVWEVLAIGDLQGLKAVTPFGFDWQTERCPKTHLAPLQKIINGCTQGKPDVWLTVAEWLMEEGADPTAQAPEEATSISFWLEEDPCGTEVTVKCEGRSAITTALRLREKMQRHEELWREEIEFLSRLVAAFAQHSERSRRRAPPRKPPASVDAGVVDRWERMLRDERSHDARLVCSGGELTAHSSVLKLASPVLRAALDSSMLEGRNQTVSVADVPTAAVFFLLELIYVGGSRTEIDVSMALSTLELAHRWQVDDVVGMVERFLAGMLSESTFDTIATAAQRMLLPGLRRSCLSFASSCAQVRERLLQGRLPTAVMELLGHTASAVDEPQEKKRRMF